MKKLHLIILGTLISSTVSTQVLARPEYVAPTGAAGCTTCHYDNQGKAPWKPGVLAAWTAGGINGLIAFVKAGASTDTAPVLSLINTQWDITVGEIPLDIPLHVADKENDTFAFHGLIPFTGFNFSALHTDASTNLPTQDLIWSPTAINANKQYAISIYALETAPSRTLKSNTVIANITVWPARTNAATALVQDFKLSSARWSANTLTLSGQVIFKPSVTVTQRSTALSSLTLQLRSNSDFLVGSPLTLKPNSAGSWTQTVALNTTQVPCLVKGNYEGLNVSRLVSGAPAASCVK